MNVRRTLPVIGAARMQEETSQGNMGSELHLGDEAMWSLVI
jgi:hypothetical protein